MTAGSPRNPRVMLDANILVSVLVSPDSARSAAAAIFELAEEGRFTAVVSVETIEETERVSAEKPWLADRVAPESVTRLVAALRRIAEVAPRLPEPAPRICRDPADDYLIAQAALARVDLLVTRDRDLLDLGDLGPVRIVDPVAFLSLLRSMQNNASNTV